MTLYSKGATAHRNQEGHTLHESDSDNIACVSKKLVGSKESEWKSLPHLEDVRITHSRDVRRDNRQYISAQNIGLLAQTKFKQSSEGLTYGDLVNDGPFKCAKSVQRARDTLHYHYREGHLFTFGRTNPQQYFATPDDAEMAAISREKNTHSHRGQVFVFSKWALFFGYGRASTS